MLRSFTRLSVFVYCPMAGEFDGPKLTSGRACIVSRASTAYYVGVTEAGQVVVLSMAEVPDCVEVRRVGASNAESEWALARGEVEPGEPVAFAAIQGSVFPDVIWNGFYPIVSERLWRLIASERFEGCQAYPCRFEGPLLPPGEYFVLGVTGRCREITFGEEDARKLRVRPDKKGRRLVYAELQVDLAEWDGADIFMGRGNRTAYRCVSERFRALLGAVRDLRGAVRCCGRV